jgi:hypothetical protein
VSAQPALTLDKTNDVLSRIANKLSHEYSPLKPGDFEIEYVDTQSFLWTATADVRPRIKLGIHPLEKGFEEVLRDALDNVRRVKLTGAIDVLASIRRRDEETRTKFQFKNNEDSLPSAEFEVSIVRKVVVTHKHTGLVSVREAYEGKATWSQLSWLARAELTELVKKLGQ